MVSSTVCDLWGHQTQTKAYIYLTIQLLNKPLLTIGHVPGIGYRDTTPSKKEYSQVNTLSIYLPLSIGINGILP